MNQNEKEEEQLEMEIETQKKDHQPTKKNSKENVEYLSQKNSNFQQKKRIFFNYNSFDPNNSTNPFHTQNLKSKSKRKSKSEKKMSKKRWIKNIFKRKSKKAKKQKQKKEKEERKFFGLNPQFAKLKELKQFEFETTSHKKSTCVSFKTDLPILSILSNLQIALIISKIDFQFPNLFSIKTKTKHSKIEIRIVECPIFAHNNLIEIQFIHKKGDPKDFYTFCKEFLNIQSNQIDWNCGLLENIHQGSCGKIFEEFISSLIDSKNSEEQKEKFELLKKCIEKNPKIKPNDPSNIPFFINLQ
ncbi:coiled-coil-helix-coiled-coil-helix domain containing 4 [Anaeramoeba ignava]|uniref:Coiled-coil-helix-coiled-coil-helix domain containing 4 n=1 Tax=Anaeramoeba ignava TaxID=1746090 RepID=A0A9Q0L7T9_ANAIG|nr:coiled-coil-helix-coiled-coil-helix domain containing 4 [Anaeramoeba ignava]